MNTFVMSVGPGQVASLNEVVQSAKSKGLKDWDKLEIEMASGAALTNAEGVRPRVSKLEIKGGKVVCGEGPFYVGYNLPNFGGRTLVNLVNTEVEGIDSYVNGRIDETVPFSKPGDVFVTCSLNKCVGVHWGRTHNGPVGFNTVEDSTIGPLQSDALTSVKTMRKVLIKGIKAFNGSHPDVHQITRPDWNAEGVVITMEDVDAVDLDCQFLHWTQIGQFCILDSVMNRVNVERRKPGQVWQSRISVPVRSCDWRDVDFGQPLQWNVAPLTRKLSFVNCIFRAGLYPKDDAVIQALSAAVWTNCEFHGGGWKPPQQP